MALVSRKAQKLAEKPGVITAEMKKGGRKYLKPEKGKIQFEVNYGIETSELSLSASEIIEIYHGLWKIEESFRVLKTDLEAKLPLFNVSLKQIQCIF
ncbi:MAG: hypothetical protein AB9907_02435 [Flexilinea sp.]